MGGETQLIVEAETGIVRRELLRRAGVLGAGLALPSSFWAACGSDDGSQAGGVLAVGSPDWLPPDLFVGNALGNHVTGWMQMAWPLFRGGGGNGKGFEYQNAIASDYEVSANGLTHAVTLREGMTFHDGSQIDAEAVVANLSAAFFEDDPLRDQGTYLHVILTLGYPPIVRSVEATDPRTVAIELTEFRHDIRTALAFTFIVKPEILRDEDYGNDVEALGEGGSGPFRITRFRAGDFAEFERYEDFVEEVIPDRVSLRSITDEGALAVALRGGDIGVAEGLSKADFDSITESGFEGAVSDPAVNVDLVIANTRDPAFEDRRVREAVGLAMNREAYTEQFFPTGTADVSSQPIIAVGVPGHIEGLEPPPYDPDAARGLMAAAGVESARLPIVGITGDPVVNQRSLIEAIAEDLSEIGIEMEITIVDQNALDAALNADEVESFISSPGGQPDPFILFDLFFAPDAYYAPGDRWLKSTPSLWNALRRAHSTQDVEERDALLREIVQTTLDESLLVPISVVGYTAVTESSIENFPITGTQLDSWHGVSVGG